MFGPGREFYKCPGLPGRPGSLGIAGRGSRVADFARVCRSWGVGRRTPATLPTLNEPARPTAALPES